MSSKGRQSRKASKVSESVSERPARRSSRRSSVATDYDNHNQKTPTKAVNNLSQYFPTCKRSSSSPRSQLSSKFTRIQSPIDRVKQHLIEDECTVTYGENNNSFDEEFVHKLNDCLDKTDDKLEINVNYSNVLNTFNSLMDEFTVEDLLSDKQMDSETKQIDSNIINDSVIPLTNLVNGHKIDANNQSMFDSENDDIYDDILSRIDTKTEDNAVLTKSSDNYEEFDFNDSFDQLISEMKIPLQPDMNQSSVEAERDLNLDKDFDSDFDDDFDLAVSRLTNEELMNSVVPQTDENCPLTRDGSTNQSSNSSNYSFLTLNEMIELINSPL